MKPRQRKLSSVWRVIKYPLAFLALPLAVGICVGIAFLNEPAPQLPLPQHMLSGLPTLDPAKPTVAIVLGRDLTEVTDVLAPYAVFKASGAFNVVMVAETRQPVRLSGNLDVLPQDTFTQLDAQLRQGPDVIVIPNIPDVAANEALRRWVRQHGQRRSMVMSVCAGAEMLAATGLIDGHPATTHWGDIDRIEHSYPKVTWVRGYRYVDNGQFISTAGILSGMDGALHVIDRMRGRALTQQVARQLHYPAQYLDNPSMPQLQMAPQDMLLFVLNTMFRWDRPTLGVALFDGVDELALAALYDTAAPLMTSRLVSVAPSGAAVTTRFGLTLVARRTPAQWAESRPLLIPGSGEQLRAPHWTAPYPSRNTVVRADHFPLDAALEDLARTTDRPTALLAAKRLEYRTLSAPLQGSTWWTSAAIIRPLLLGLLALVLVYGTDQFPRVLAPLRRIWK